MRRNLKFSLEKAGHQVAGEATDRAEAHRLYERTQSDLVTMDITMPNMNGIDAVKKMSASNLRANIIMISAIDQRSMALEAFRAYAVRIEEPAARSRLSARRIPCIVCS